MRKSAPRVEAYGTVDELNSWLGMAAALLADEDLLEVLLRLQRELFELGADLATPPGGRPGQRTHSPRIGEEHVRGLEDLIDTFEAELPPLRSFILPGGHPAAAALHVARTVARRAERRAVAAVDAGEAISPAALQYLNRLSDLLFVLARVANKRTARGETPWQPRTP